MRAKRVKTKTKKRKHAFTHRQIILHGTAKSFQCAQLNALAFNVIERNQKKSSYSGVSDHND